VATPEQHATPPGRLRESDLLEYLGRPDYKLPAQRNLHGTGVGHWHRRVLRQRRKDGDLIDLTTFATTMTVKNGGSVCYSMVVTGILAPPMTIVFKDGSGTTVGTMAVDPTTNAMSVTCPGGTATVIDQSCGTGRATSPVQRRPL